MTRHHLAVAMAGAALLAGTPALAQSRQSANAGSPAVAILNSVPASEQPDVVLDIPNLSVEEITLEVDKLEAHVSLDARLANLLKITAGADASIDKVKLSIKGVKAQAALIVRLDNVKAMVDRTLETLDKNPAIIEQLGSTLDNTVSTVGGVAGQAVSTVGDLTQGVLRSGAVLDLAKSGLATVSQTVNSAGQTVRRLRASDGAVYEVVSDAAGKIVRSAKVG